jgi:hypothetical protein
MNSTPTTLTRRSTGLVLAIAVLLSSAFLPAMAQEGPQGTFRGLVLDPSGEPAEGFRLVFQAEGSDFEFISPPSDSMGNYTLSLPAGVSYKLVAAIAPDGMRLEVPQLPPIPATEGVRRLDVRFRYPDDPGFTPEDERWSRLAELPWWRIGGAAVAVVVFSAIVFDGDDGETPASSYQP